MSFCPLRGHQPSDVRHDIDDLEGRKEAVLNAFFRAVEVVFCLYNSNGIVCAEITGYNPHI